MERSILLISVLETGPPGHFGGISQQCGYSPEGLEREEREKERSDAFVTGSPPSPHFNTIHPPNPRSLRTVLRVQEGPKRPEVRRALGLTTHSRCPSAEFAETCRRKRSKEGRKELGTRSLPGVFFLHFLTLKTPVTVARTCSTPAPSEMISPFLALELVWTSPLHLGRGFLSYLYTGNSCVSMPGVHPRCQAPTTFPG